MSYFSGIGLGVGLKNSRDEPWSRREAMYVRYIGELFLNMLKCVIIPLVVPSLIASIGRETFLHPTNINLSSSGSMNIALSGRVGLRAIIYYILTTLIAVILGIGLVVTIKPGTGVDNDVEPRNTTKKNISTVDTLMDLPRNCFPPNIIQATLQQYHTELVYPGENVGISDFPDFSLHSFL